jgi:integrase
MGKPKWLRKWEGGRVREGRGGAEVFVIEKYIGKPYVVTLDVDSPELAKAHLDLFTANPVAYLESRGKVAEEAWEKLRAAQDAAEKPEGLFMRGQLIQDFLDHQEAAGTDRDYRKSQLRYLKQWAKVLDGRDLRQVSVTDLKSKLRGWKTAVHARKVAIKSFYTWLETGAEDPATGQPLITSAQNAGRALQMEKPRAAKLSKENLLIPLKTIEAVYSKITSQRVRDQLCILAKTGLHQSELARFAQGKNKKGDVIGKLRVVKPKNGIAGVMHVVHKNGHEHLMALDEQCVAAAQRLQNVGKAIDRWAMARSIEAAVDAISREPGKTAKGSKTVQRVDPFVPKFLRHSYGTHAEVLGRVVTYPKRRGVDRDTIRRSLGHRDEQMFEEHYRLTQVPPMIVLPLKLVHPEDP